VGPAADHHHHQITRSSHSINAIDPAPPLGGPAADVVPALQLAPAQLQWQALGFLPWIPLTNSFYSGY
jgi:hypothetical protein